MADMVHFSDQQLSLSALARFHDDAKAGLFEFFSGDSKTLVDRYSDSRRDEALERALSELGVTSALSVMASLEAAIRLDYLRRVYGRWRDPLSKAMKALHNQKETGARLEDDLLRLWKEQTASSKALLGALVGAFKYRHWLAHGRYWVPKFGRRYDYETVFELAQEFSDAMDIYNGARRLSIYT